jgi:hypothetical protein
MSKPKEPRPAAFHESLKKTAVKPQKDSHGRHDQGNASEVKRRMKPELPGQPLTAAKRPSSRQRPFDVASQQ